MPPQVGREEKELRYKISVDTADLETTFARLDQRVSAAISGMGMRPLDIFTTAERRFEIAQAVAVPYAGRRLEFEERRAIAEVTLPEALMQYVPLVPQIFGTEMIARQQQSVAAAGILRQTGQRVTSENIGELMQTMRRIDVDIPGIRATDVAMAASFLQAMPGAIRGLPKQEVEGRIREIVQSQEVLRETFGLTKENQIREMMVPFVQMDMADRAGAVSQLASSVSRITNRPETESLGDLFTAGGISRSHGLPFEFGARAYLTAQAGVETAIRKFGLHGAEIQSLGGPTGAAMRLVEVQARILKSPDIDQALAVMSERTGGRFDPTLFRQLVGERAVATREVMNNFNAHRFDVYEQAMQNPQPIVEAFLDTRSTQHGGRDKAIRALGDMLGSRRLAQGFADESSVTDQVFSAERERIFAELRPRREELGIFGTITTGTRDLISLATNETVRMFSKGVDAATDMGRAIIGAVEAKEEGKIALFTETGKVPVNKVLGGQFKQDLLKLARDHNIDEKLINQYFTTKGEDVVINMQGLMDFQNSFGKNDQTKRAAISAGVQNMFRRSADSVKKKFEGRVNIQEFRNYISQGVAGGADLESLLEPAELLGQEFIREAGALSPDERSRRQIAESLSEAKEEIALAMVKIPTVARPEHIIGAGPGRRAVLQMISPRQTETTAPLQGGGAQAFQVAAQEAANALLRLADI